MFMKFIFIPCLILVVCFSSCRDDDFEKNKKEVEFRESFDLLVNDIPIMDSGTFLNIESEFCITDKSDSMIKYNATAGDILNAEFIQTDLWVQDFCNVNLSFIKSIKLYILADGQPELYLTTKENVSSTAGGIGWTINHPENFENYLNSGQFKVRMELESDEETLEKSYLKFKLRFIIKAYVPSQ